MSITQKVQTPLCINCGKFSVIEVPKSNFDLWKSGTLIQRAFPEMSVDDREMLITGIHPDCWTEMFGEDDDDE